MAIIVNRPWTEQPVDSPVVRHDFTRGAVAYGVAAGAGKVGDRALTIVSVAGSVAPFGASYTHDAADSSVTKYFSLPATATASPWTTIVYAVLTSSGSSAVTTFAESPGSGTYDRSLNITTAGNIGCYIFDGGQKTCTSTGAVTVGVPFVGAVVASGSDIVAYLNGVPGTATAVANTGCTGYTTPEMVIGYGGGNVAINGDANRGARIKLAYAVTINRALSRAELAQIAENPWGLFEPRRILVPVAAAGGGGTGTVAQTLAALTSAATGTLPIVGALSQTLGALTSTAAGALPIVGAGSATLASLTASAAGVLPIVGQSSATLGTLTATATGRVAIAGQLGITLGDLAVLATGVSASGPAGMLAATLADLTASAAGVLPIVGQASATLGALTSAATGRVAIAAQLGITLGDLVVSATGTGATLAPIVGTLTATLANMTLVAAGGEAPLAERVRLSSPIATSVALSSPLALSVALASHITRGVTLTSAIDLEQ